MSTMHSNGNKPDNVGSLERSLENLRLNNNNDTCATSAPVKDTLSGQSKEVFSRPALGRVTSLEDVLEEGTTSPLRHRVGRSPRRRVDEEPPQTGICRLRSRRRSDPGRVSVSPLRARLRIDAHILEDGDYTAASRLPVRRSSSLDPTEIDEAVPVMYGLRSRSRSPHTQIKLRSRSRSLPGIDLELGEAIGALAVRQMALDSARKATGRRRSVSMETPAPLEAILEENAAGQKTSRRFSTSSVKSPTAL